MKRLRTGSSNTLRDVAQQLRSMGWDRWNAVSQAMSDFSGGYAKRFEAACATESTDRGALARALDALADDVEGAKAQARLERERIAAHEAWQERVAECERVEKFAFSGGFPSLAVFPGLEPSTRPRRPPEISASFGPGIRNRYAGGGDAGGTTSAAPASLRSFVSRSRALTSRMSAGRSDVRGAVAAYTGACSWAPLSVSALLTGFSRLIEENRADEIWIEDVASAFEAAGKGALGDFDVMLVVNARHPEELSKLLLSGTLTQAQIAATWAALTKSADFDAEKFIKKHSFELGVFLRDVGQSADGWLAADGGVGPVVIVGVQPGRECVAAG